MDDPPEEERFHANIIGLMEFVQDYMSSIKNDSVNAQLIDFAKCLINNYDKRDLIDIFIHRSNASWEEIRCRDDSFFKKNAGEIFDIIPMSNIDTFTKIFTLVENGDIVIDNDFKDTLWDYFDSLIIISIKYIHKKREPYSTPSSDGKGIFTSYQKSYMDQIDVINLSKKWEIVLTYS